MKKQLLLAFGLFAIIGFSNGQDITARYQTPIEIPSNIDRYKVDYELMDESYIAQDSLILEQLDLTDAEQFRLESTEFIHRDQNTHLFIRLYPINKIAKPTDYLDTNSEN